MNVQSSDDRDNYNIFDGGSGELNRAEDDGVGGERRNSAEHTSGRNAH